MKINTDFLYFCMKLQGWNVINKDGFTIPRYILFWSGYKADDLLNNKTIFNITSRINN